MNTAINDSSTTEHKIKDFKFFETNLAGQDNSGGMNNNGWRRFKRYGIVPQSFFIYLMESRIIKPDAQIPERRIMVGELLDFLKCYPYESEQARYVGDYLFQKILKTNIPSLSKTFAQRGQA